MNTIVKLTIIALVLLMSGCATTIRETGPHGSKHDHRVYTPPPGQVWKRPGEAVESPSDTLYGIAQDGWYGNIVVNIEWKAKRNADLVYQIRKCEVYIKPAGSTVSEYGFQKCKARFAATDLYVDAPIEGKNITFHVSASPFTCVGDMPWVKQWGPLTVRRLENPRVTNGVSCSHSGFVSIGRR